MERNKFGQFKSKSFKGFKVAGAILFLVSLSVGVLNAANMIYGLEQKFTPKTVVAYSGCNITASSTGDTVHDGYETYIENQTCVYMKSDAWKVQEQKDARLNVVEAIANRAYTETVASLHKK